MNRTKKCPDCGWGICRPANNKITNYEEILGRKRPKISFKLVCMNPDCDYTRMVASDYIFKAWVDYAQVGKDGKYKGDDDAD